jgi:hypothetical protein
MSFWLFALIIVKALQIVAISYMIRCILILHYAVAVCGEWRGVRVALTLMYVLITLIGFYSGLSVYWWLSGPDPDR